MSTPPPVDPPNIYPATGVDDVYWTDDRETFYRMESPATMNSDALRRVEKIRSGDVGALMSDNPDVALSDSFARKIFSPVGMASVFAIPQIGLAMAITSVAGVAYGLRNQHNRRELSRDLDVGVAAAKRAFRQSEFHRNRKRQIVYWAKYATIAGGLAVGGAIFMTGLSGLAIGAGGALAASRFDDGLKRPLRAAFDAVVARHTRRALYREIPGLEDNARDQALRNDRNLRQLHDEVTVRNHLVDNPRGLAEDGPIGRLAIRVRAASWFGTVVSMVPAIVGLAINPMSVVQTVVAFTLGVTATALSDIEGRRWFAECADKFGEGFAATRRELRGGLELLDDYLDNVPSRIGRGLGRSLAGVGHKLGSAGAAVGHGVAEAGRWMRRHPVAAVAAIMTPVVAAVAIVGARFWPSDNDKDINQSKPPQQQEQTEPKPEPGPTLPEVQANDVLELYNNGQLKEATALWEKTVGDRERDIDMKSAPQKRADLAEFLLNAAVNQDGKTTPWALNGTKTFKYGAWTAVDQLRQSAENGNKKAERKAQVAEQFTLDLQDGKGPDLTWSTTKQTHAEVVSNAQKAGDHKRVFEVTKQRIDQVEISREDVTAMFDACYGLILRNDPMERTEDVELASTILYYSKAALAERVITRAEASRATSFANMVLKQADPTFTPQNQANMRGPALGH